MKAQTEKWPPLDPGTRVRTNSKKTADSEWMPEALVARKWGVTGTIIMHHDSHGLCYDVRHDDGTKGCYEPTEFDVIAADEHKYPERAPKYNFGDVLVSKRGFRGRVTMMFANYDAVLSAGIVGRNWFDIQEIPPSTKDQVFYHLVGDGAALAGELDVYPAMTTRAI